MKKLLSEGGKVSAMFLATMAASVATLDDGQAVAGTVTINSTQQCSSYSSITLDANANVTINCSQATTTATTTTTSSTTTTTTTSTSTTTTTTTTTSPSGCTTSSSVSRITFSNFSSAGKPINYTIPANGAALSFTVDSTSSYPGYKFAISIEDAAGFAQQAKDVVISRCAGDFVNAASTAAGNTCASYGVGVLTSTINYPAYFSFLPATTCPLSDGTYYLNIRPTNQSSSATFIMTTSL